MSLQLRFGTEEEVLRNIENIIPAEPVVATDTEKLYIGSDYGDYFEIAKVDDLPVASDQLPLMDSEASAGDSAEYSRADHVHPNDTTKANVTDVEAALALKADASKVFGNSVSFATQDSDWTSANFLKNTATSVRYVTDTTTRLASVKTFAITEGSKIKITCPIGAKYRVFFFSTAQTFENNTYYTIVDAGLDDVDNWHTDSRTLIVPAGAASFALVIAFSDNATITPSTRPNFVIVKETLESRIKTLEDSDFVDYTKMVDTFIEQIGGFKRKNNSIVWKNGYINPSAPLPTTGTTSSTTRCCDSAPNAIDNSNNNKSIYVECPTNKKVRVTFWTNASSSALIPTASNTNWTTGGLLVTVPSNASYYRVSVAYDNNSSISPLNCADVSVFEIIGVYLELFSGKKISILGDSISTFAGINAESAGDVHTIADGTYTYAGNHCRYPNSYLSNVNDTYWKKLIDAFDMKLGINDSWAGSKVSWSGTESSDVGANIYIASPTRIGHLDDNGTPDIILVNAGTNDIGTGVTVGTFNTESPVNYTDAQIAALSVATFADAYRAMLIRLQKAYPLAKIVVMLPNYTTSYYNPTQADSYLEIIKEACDYFGVPYIDMRTSGITMYNTGTYTGDGIHPNVAGMELLFEKVYKFFKYSL